MDQDLLLCIINMGSMHWTLLVSITMYTMQYIYILSVIYKGC